MDIFTWTVVATVVLSLICAGGALYSHLRGHGPRPVLRWAALGLVPIGLLITGAMRPVVIGAQAVGQYFQHATLTLAMIIGLSIIGVAALVYVVAGRLSPRTRQQAKQVRASRRGGAVPAGQAPAVTRGAAGQSVAPGAPAARGGRVASAPVDDEMAEIEALLKKRGIE
ncbi:hypothetical protein ACSDQ9_12055 [Aestuariimicrobium soli]|uniref:hypothetical protein n=1 Tax=Aestuariimicrobium soli TaxID=2035834 RepID=UPI003EB9D81E